MPLRTKTSTERRGGFTIVEVIVAVIIIGILASILTPTLMTHSKKARVTATQQELEHLADVSERAAIDTGYFYRLNVLDDVPGPGDGEANHLVDSKIESIRDNAVDTDNIYDSPTRIFILSETGDYATNYSTIFDRMIDSETKFNWNGPYINWRHDENQNDWPNDPYGNDYILFTRAGAIAPPIDPASTTEVLNQDNSSSFNETLSYYVTPVAGGDVVLKEFDARVFDRPTLLSLGPNGLPGDGTDGTENDFGTGDDIIRQFGGN